jgi:hypothetical protein
MLKLIIVFFLYLLTHNIGQAFPKDQSTKLPMPKSFLKFDRKNALNVMSLEVYQDSEDPNLYYYVPPFHIRQYKQGAASPFLSSDKVADYVKAKKLIDEREAYFKDYYGKLVPQYEPKVEKSKAAFDKAKIEYLEAVEKGRHPEVIRIYKETLDSDEKLYNYWLSKLNNAQNIAQNVADNGFKSVPELMKKSFFSQVSTSVSFAGYDVDMTDFQDKTDDEILHILRSGLGKAFLSGAGFLTINAYAGFTQAQLEGLRRYKAEYAPDIKVTLLHMDDLKLFGLDEAYEGDPADGGYFNMIKRVNGSGDYLGMAIYMDLTVAAGVQFGKHLDPFILPIGIKGEFNRYLLPSEAVLDCDFSNGFKVQGRADVKDGLIIFDDDIANSMKVEDASNGACSLTNIKGDIQSAQILALMELEKQYDEMNLRRTILSREEKEVYFNGVLKDIEANRRPANKGNVGGLLGSFLSLGLPGLIVDGLSRATNFHWHTNEQDLEKISKVKFTKKFSINGHTKFSKKLPTSLCLVYNPINHSYDRCTDEELEKAETMQKAGKKASESESCKGISDPFECGKKRDSILSRIDRSYNDDTALVEDI